MKLKYLFVSFMFLGLFACERNTNSGGTSTDTPTTAPETPPVVEDPRPAFYLEGLYATSTATGSDIRNVFDGNAQTRWETILGAGPDEGIMIYLPVPKYIHQLKIDGAKGATYADILDLSVFVNGVPIANGGLGDRIPIEEEVKSLYIRFLTTEAMTSDKMDRQGKSLTINHFSKKHQLGITDIFLYKKEGGAHRVVPPRIVNGTLKASSTLAPTTAYDAALLFDARKEFAWVEGAPTDGKGEKIVFELAEEITITGLKIWNGYQRSAGHYQKNTRVKVFSFGANSPDSKRYDFNLRDSPAGQQIPFGVRLTGSSFQLEATEVFPGTAYEDMAISELLLFNEKEPLIVRSNFAQASQQKYREAAQGSSLAPLLDSRIYNLVVDADTEAERSLILRSDGTFVNYAYAYNSENNDEVKTISDGNWEILSATPGEVKLKLFGKFFDYTNMEAYYKGAAANKMTRIFKDVVTIKDGVIRGEKFIDVLYLR